MNDPYSILGISRNATDEEIKDAYRNLARKYHPDNYTDDNPLKDLAKEKMQEVNAAYDTIQRERMAGNNSSSGYGQSYTNNQSYGNSSSGTSPIYITIRQKINEKRFHEAENLLMGIAPAERTADWHFLSSVCLFKRGRNNDAMAELEMACNMDPSNMEYQKAKEMFNSRTSSYGSMYYGTGTQRSNSDDACDCCMRLWCCDTLCECFGGDLISCC